MLLHVIEGLWFLFIFWSEVWHQNQLSRVDKYQVITIHWQEASLWSQAVHAWRWWLTGSFHQQTYSTPFPKWQRYDRVLQGTWAIFFETLLSETCIKNLLSSSTLPPFLWDFGKNNLKATLEGNKVQHCGHLSKHNQGHGCPIKCQCVWLRTCLWWTFLSNICTMLISSDFWICPLACSYNLNPTFFNDSRFKALKNMEIFHLKSYIPWDESKECYCIVCFLLIRIILFLLYFNWRICVWISLFCNKQQLNPPNK